MRKNFVLDTNVLLHDPRALEKFEENNVIVPIYVIEEIDGFKRQLTELGRNAREVSRILDEYREMGNLREGVPTTGGGTLRVAFTHKRLEDAVLNSHTQDNLILGVALHVREQDPETPCVFVTKDTNLRVRADVLDLRAENYDNDNVSISELYPGACEVEVPDELIDELHDDGRLELDLEEFRPRVSESADENPGEHMNELFPNEYILLKSLGGGNQTSLGRVHRDDGTGELRIRPLNRRSRDDVWGVRPRNKEQAFALDALLDDRIQLVTLIGKAGTGKTLLAIAAGLRKTTDEQLYQKLVVSRPIFPMGRDIGYLPGTMEEKLNPWMRPIFDNVEYLMGLSNADKKAGRGAESDSARSEDDSDAYRRGVQARAYGRSLPDRQSVHRQ